METCPEMPRQARRVGGQGQGLEEAPEAPSPAALVHPQARALRQSPAGLRAPSHPNLQYLLAGRLSPGTVPVFNSAGAGVGQLTGSLSLPSSARLTRLSQYSTSYGLQLRLLSTESRALSLSRSTLPSLSQGSPAPNHVFPRPTFNVLLLSPTRTSPFPHGQSSRAPHTTPETHWTGTTHSHVDP